MVVTAQNLIEVCSYTVENIIEVCPTRKVYIVNKQLNNGDWLLASFIVNSKNTLVNGTHYRWQTLDKRSNYIEGIIKQAAEREEAKARRKYKQLLAAENVQVGDIFVAQYGYEANFCDFMQIVAKNGNRVKVKPLAKQSIFGSDYDANGSPHRISSAVKDNFTLDAKTYSKPLHGECFRHNSHHYYKWSGNAITEYNDH